MIDFNVTVSNPTYSVLMRSQKGHNNRPWLSSRFPHEIAYQFNSFTPFYDAKLINVNNLSEQCTAILYEPIDDTVHGGRR